MQLLILQSYTESSGLRSISSRSFLFGILKKCRKKCPYDSLAKTRAGKLDVMKNVPLGWGQKCWDIPMCVIICVPTEDRQKVKMSQEVSPVVCRSKGNKKMGYPKMRHYLCANYGAGENGDAPRNICADLLPDVIKSVTGFGRKSGNRHFANCTSSLKINH